MDQLEDTLAHTSININKDDILVVTLHARVESTGMNSCIILMQNYVPTVHDIGNKFDEDFVRIP